MLIFKPSEISNNRGGDIAINSDSIPPAEILDLTPEDWFLTTTIYKGWYVYAEEGTEAFDIRLYTHGGSLSSVYDYIESQFESSGDVTSLEQMEKFFYGRYEFKIPPFLPKYYELDYYANPSDVGSETQKEEMRFYRWFQDNVINSSTNKESLYQQMKVGLSSGPQRILGPVSEDLDGLDFSEQLNLPNLNPGEYWGFYMRIEDNFIPDYQLYSDLTTLSISWKEYIKDAQGNYVLDSNGNRTFDEFISKAMPIVLNAEIGGIPELHALEVEKMYENFPEYFIYYKDIEE